MLNPGALALVAAFLFLVALLGGTVPGRSGSWGVNLAGVAAVTVFSALTLVSIPALTGWPTGGEPPPKFRLLAVHIQQPDKQTRGPGAVFLWAVDAGSLSRSAEPRAYRLPYSGALHEAAAAAGRKLGSGVAQLGEFAGSEAPAGGWLEEPGSAGEAVVALKFYDVPDPLYPEG